jgi:hypothetical protein
MHRARRLLSTAAVVAAMTLGLVSAGLAQDATPTSMEDMEPPDTLLAHLHMGTCLDHGEEPVAELADLELPAWAGAMIVGSDADMETEGVVAEDFGNAPVPVAVATTEVETPLAEIISGGHSIEIESSDTDDPEDVLVCGDIGGIPDENGDLFVGLEAVGDSGHNGIVWLHDNGTGTTIVVFVAHPEEQAGIAERLMGLAAMVEEEEAMAATPMAGAEATPVMADDATPTA